MKKVLPILLLVFILFSSTLIAPPEVTRGQQPVPQGQTQAQAQIPASEQTTGWAIDSEVTFVGKNAARSGKVLNWTLLNYQWSCVTRVGDRNCDNDNNPLSQFWQKIVFSVVAPMLILVILVTSAVIIITRGKSLTIMRFIPRFIAVLVLIAFSYSILQFLYQFFDLIQGFFLRSNPNISCPPNCIQDSDLLYVGWKYEDFVGLRLLGDSNAESAFMSLLLTKLTALTYFVMVGILIIRKIILWFFIIISPVFPILLLYYPVRNTGKIWIGEFFRWLLYGPLFAIFLQGLVFMWSHKPSSGGGGGGGGIPLQFANPAINDPNKIMYPTAINILLGGPQQFVTQNNSVNLPETFMLYVVALIMLWIVILLPWVLLQIFLDYAANLGSGDNTVMKNLVNMVSNKMVPPTSPAGHLPQSGGTALNLPFTKKTVNIPVMPMPGGAAKTIIREAQKIGTARPITAPLAKVSAEVMSFANIPLPTMRDIARYEKALISNNMNQKQEVVQIQQTLEKIANPVAVTSTIERERYSNMKERLVQESQQGNIVATTIMNAVNNTANNQSRRSAQISTTQMSSVLKQISNPAQTTNIVNRERMTKLHEMLSRESSENKSELASTLLSVNEKTSSNEMEKIKETLMRAQQQGNPIASSVLTQISSIQKSSENVKELRTVLSQIANPALATNVIDREKYTTLHNTLQKEGQQNNNTLAQSILKVNDETAVEELGKIREQLYQSKESVIASSVLSTINDFASQQEQTVKIKNILQQVANPATASATDREKINQLHETLKKESQNGDELATSLLAVSEETSVADIEKLQEKLNLEKDKGKVIAKDVLDIAAKEKEAEIPSTNRIQNVTQEELEEVKKMWKDTYSNLEVPEAVAGSRNEWIRSDYEKINTIINDLSSGDQSKINEGIQEVSNILPFLLVGGFSQSDIISYLTVKQEAAKEVLQGIAAEEETKVKVESKHTTAAQTMTATIEESTIGASTPTFETTNIITPQVSNEILAMVNLRMPAMRDIARLEAMSLARDRSKATELQKTKEILENIATTASIQIPAEREKMEQLRAHLIEESQKGNPTADIILKAANSYSKKIDEIATTVPSENKMQAVTQEDYDEIKKMWEENYRTLPVPIGFSDNKQGRIDWIKKDSEEIQATIDLMQSTDAQKRSEGLSKVGTILPFLLLGGFSYQEIASYLNVKLEAAKTVLSELTQSEESEEKVDVAVKTEETQEKPKEMAD